jgi:hypothetical protein
MATTLPTKIDAYKAQLQALGVDAVNDAIIQAQARVTAKYAVDQADFQLAADVIVQQYSQEMIDKLNALQVPVDPSVPVEVIG